MDAPTRAEHDARMDMVLIVLVGAVFLSAGVVKGVSGMGLPTLSMAMLGLFMPAASAAALMVLPSLATNTAQCVGPHARALLRRLWPLWLALALGTLFSPLPSLADAGRTTQWVLGTVLLLYGLCGWFKPALPRPGACAPALGGLAGLGSGLLSAATGIFVMPLVPYLQSLRLSKDEMIQALGLSFTVATLALMLRLGRGPWVDTALTPLITALLAALAGLWLGTRLRARLQPAVFQRALYAVFMLLGTVIAGRALG